MDYRGINQTPYGCTRQALNNGFYSFVWPESGGMHMVWTYARKDYAIKKARQVMAKYPDCRELRIFSRVGTVIEILVR